jgi:hypothetical protein
MEPEGSYRVHKNPTLVPILSQINPIRAIPFYFSKIHFNIVHLARTLQVKRIEEMGDIYLLAQCYKPP